MATKLRTAAAPELRVISADELETILNGDDLGSKLVPMPEWGKDAAVRIRGLSMTDVWEARKACEDIPPGVDRTSAIEMHFIQLAVVEPTLSAAQVEKLRGKSSDAVLRLINEISTLNGSTAGVRESAAGEFPASSDR